MSLETWSSKPRLELWILLSHPPQTPLWCTELLTALARQLPLHVIWINNGLPVRTEALIQRQELRYSFETVHYSLAFSPLEIFSHTCHRTVTAEAVLWLEDRILIAPERILDWLTHLNQWPAIYPTHTFHHDQDRRLQQEPTFIQQGSPLNIQPIPPTALPPCLLFPINSQPLLQEWSHPKGQMVFWFPGCDLGAQVYAEPVGDHGVTNPMGIAQATLAWQSALSTHDPSQLYVLAQTYPQSALVYTHLARWSDSAASAILWLHQALSQNLYFPEILQLLQLAWSQLGHIDLAERISQYLENRFPDYVREDESWPSAGSWAQELPVYEWPLRPTLAISIMVVNEGSLLPECLASVKNLANELLVVDTGSTDDTVACAQAAGAKVLHLPWAENFAAVRNYALDAIQSEWVLVLDADERLKPESVDYLQQFLWNNPPGLKHFAPRLLNVDDSGQIQLVHRVSRLFPNHPTLRFQGRVHEYVTSPCTAPMSYAIPLDIVHLGYQESLFKGRGKAKRNLHLLQLAQADEPNHPRWDYYLALHAQQAHQIQAALNHLDQALEYAKPIQEWESLRQDIYLLYLQMLIAQGSYPEAEKLARSCQQICLNSPDYWYNLGFILKSLDRLVEAAWAFEHCLSLKGQVLTLQGSYHYFALDRYPLLGLMDIYWLQTINRGLSPSLRLQALKRLLDTLRRLWAYYPDGTYNSYEANLYILLGKACIWGMTYRLESSLPGLFEVYLLPESRGNWRYQVETVLLFFDGQLERCQERLAGLAGFEDLQDLRANPPYLLSFARILWEQGTENAMIFTTALLALASAYYQDVSYDILLIQFHEQSGLQQTALNLTLDAQQVYTNNPYLHYQAGRLFYAAEMWSDSLRQFERATELKPDFDEAWPYLASLPEKMGS